MCNEWQYNMACIATCMCLCGYKAQITSIFKHMKILQVWNSANSAFEPTCKFTRYKWSHLWNKQHSHSVITRCIHALQGWISQAQKVLWKSICPILDFLFSALLHVSDQTTFNIRHRFLQSQSISVCSESGGWLVHLLVCFTLLLCYITQAPLSFSVQTDGRIVSFRISW